MANETMLEIAKNAVALAKQKGAGDIAAVATESRDVDVTWRDGKLEKISEATSRQLEARLYVDGRYSACSTSDLRPDALSAFFENAVALTRTLAKDTHRSLPDPSLYGKVAASELQLVDPRFDELTAMDMRRNAQKIEEAARSVPGSNSILSVTSGMSQSSRTTTRVHSNGFEGTFATTTFSNWAGVSIQDADGRRPEEDDYGVTRFVGDLPDVATVGRRATERTLGRRGAKKIGSGVMGVVMENRAAGRFLGYLLGPLSGSSLQQKRSFLDGLVGKPFGSDKLDIADDPLLSRGLGSRPFDSEGIGAKRLSIFEQGVLKNYYIDTYYGKKAGNGPDDRWYVEFSVEARNERSRRAYRRHQRRCAHHVVHWWQFQRYDGRFFGGFSGFCHSRRQNRRTHCRNEPLRQACRHVETSDRRRKRSFRAIVFAHANTRLRWIASSRDVNYTA
jgi:PmbA protein